MQQSLFAPTKGWEQFRLLDASVRIQRDFMMPQVGINLTFRQMGQP